MSVDERVRELEQLRDRVAGVMNLPAGTTDDQIVAAAFNAYGAAHPEGPGSDDRAELERLRGALERAEDALAEADQTQQRSDDQRGDTRDGVMQAIVEAGLAGYVCDDDDLPDMVRHALTAAKKLAQPALWTYNDRGEPESQAAPVDWAPRFRAASAAASQEGFDALAAHFAEAAEYLQLPGRAEAVERALIGEEA